MTCSTSHELLPSWWCVVTYVSRLYDSSRTDESCHACMSHGMYQLFMSRMHESCHIVNLKSVDNQVHLWSMWMNSAVLFWLCFEYPNSCVCTSQTPKVTPQYAATRCNTLTRTVAHCNVQQHTTTRCNALYHTAIRRPTLQHAATHSSTLEQTVTHYSTLYHAAAQCYNLQYTTTTQCNTLQLAAKHATQFNTKHTDWWHIHARSKLNKRQHTATRCNTLQHAGVLQTYCKITQHLKDWLLPKTHEGSKINSPSDSRANSRSPARMHGATRHNSSFSGIWIYVYIYMYIDLCMYIYIHICIHICVCVHSYIIYIY